MAGAVLPGCSGGVTALVAILACSSGRRMLRLSATFDDLQTLSDRQDRERLGLLAEAMHYYAIFTLDAEGRISSWNLDAERILGYRPDDVLNRSVACLYSDEEVRRDVPQKNLSWATGDGRVEDVRWIRRKDGFRFEARVAIVAIRDADAALCGFTYVIHEVEAAEG